MELKPTQNLSVPYKRHIPSFVVSIAIHLVAIVSFLYISTYFTKTVKKEEQRVSIRLNMCVPQEKIPQEKLKVKKVIKNKLPKQQQIKHIDKKIVQVKNKLEKKEEIFYKIPIKEEKKVKEVIEEEPKIENIEVKEEIVVHQEVNTTTPKQTEPVQVVIPKEKEYIDVNLAKISELLSDNLYYPRRARKKRVEGIVVVRFKLFTNAQVDSVSIVSSKHKILSRAAIKTIENLSGKFPKPKEELILQIPIKYSLK